MLAKAKTHSSELKDSEETVNREKMSQHENEFVPIIASFKLLHIFNFFVNLCFVIAHR